MLKNNLRGKNVEQSSLPRVQWKDNSNAVELGFDFYLQLLERRLKGEEVSLVQSLRGYYRGELGINLRETQARGLMHRASSVFIDYVKAVSGQDFTPGIQFWENRELDDFFKWRGRFFKARSQAAVDIEADSGEAITEEDERGRIVERIQSLTDERDSPPQRQATVVNRIIRDSTLSRFLKLLYDFECQICRFSFSLPSGTKYAESHHVKPLGSRHRGLDVESNMLILCPNHHAMMDYGVIAIHPQKLVVMAIRDNVSDSGKNLQVVRHTVNSEFLEYHLSNVFNRVL